MNSGFLYTQIYETLLDDIVKGVYKSGDILPSEKALCKQYDVSIITVRRALKALEDANIIMKMKGKGSIVNANIRKTESSVNKNIGILDLALSGLRNVEYPPVPFNTDLYNQNEWKNMIYSSIYNLLSDQYNLILGTYDRNEILQNFEDTVFTNVQRIFVIGTYNQELIDFLISKGKLVVVYNNFDKNLSVCNVSTDERKKASEIVEQLIHLGHKKIAAINGDITFSESVERSMGYQEALMKNGVPVQWSLIKWGNMSSESGYHLTKQILASGEKPTAIVCVNDNVAAGCLAAIDEFGLHCPDDISVVGHDNNALIQPIINNSLTSIDPQYNLIGEKIAEKLVREIWFDDSTIIPGQIQLRNSIAKPKTE